MSQSPAPSPNASSARRVRSFQSFRNTPQRSRSSSRPGSSASSSSRRGSPPPEGTGICAVARSKVESVDYALSPDGSEVVVIGRVENTQFNYVLELWRVDEKQYVATQRLESDSFAGVAWVRWPGGAGGVLEGAVFTTDVAMMRLADESGTPVSIAGSSPLSPPVELPLGFCATGTRVVVHRGDSFAVTSLPDNAVVLHVQAWQAHAASLSPLGTFVALLSSRSSAATEVVRIRPDAKVDAVNAPPRDLLDVSVGVRTELEGSYAEALTWSDDESRVLLKTVSNPYVVKVYNSSTGAVLGSVNISVGERVLFGPTCTELIAVGTDALRHLTVTPDAGVRPHFVVRNDIPAEPWVSITRAVPVWIQRQFVNAAAACAMGITYPPAMAADPLWIVCTRVDGAQTVVHARSGTVVAHHLPCAAGRCLVARVRGQQQAVLKVHELPHMALWEVATQPPDAAVIPADVWVFDIVSWLSPCDVAAA